MRIDTHPDGDARTYNIHLFARGLEDETCVVELFRALLESDIRRAPACDRDKRGTKHAVASLQQVRQLHPETNEIVVCTGLGIEDSGMQVWEPVAMGLFVDGRQRGWRVVADRDSEVRRELCRRREAEPHVAGRCPGCGNALSEPGHCLCRTARTARPARRRDTLTTSGAIRRRESPRPPLKQQGRGGETTHGAGRGASIKTVRYGKRVLQLPVGPQRSTTPRHTFGSTIILTAPWWPFRDPDASPGTTATQT